MPLQVYRQVVSSLVYLHSKRVIHCDLKEANVMIAGDSNWDNPKVPGPATPCFPKQRWSRPAHNFGGWF